MCDELICGNSLLWFGTCEEKSTTTERKRAFWGCRIPVILIYFSFSRWHASEESDTSNKDDNHEHRTTAERKRLTGCWNTTFDWFTDCPIHELVKSYKHLNHFKRFFALWVDFFRKSIFTRNSKAWLIFCTGILEIRRALGWHFSANPYWQFRVGSCRIDLKSRAFVQLYQAIRDTFNKQVWKIDFARQLDSSLWTPNEGEILIT